MSKLNQIRVIQDGSELFAVDTIAWPEEIFKYPIVYTAVSMDRGSFDAGRVGWTWIEREQFEWLLKHHACMVSCIGTGDIHTFYCHNHRCWEKEGKDYPMFTDFVTPYKPDSDLLEEREI